MEGNGEVQLTSFQKNKMGKKQQKAKKKEGKKGGNEESSTLCSRSLVSESGMSVQLNSSSDGFRPHISFDIETKHWLVKTFALFILIIRIMTIITNLIECRVEKTRSRSTLGHGPANQNSCFKILPLLKSSEVVGEEHSSWRSLKHGTSLQLL